MSGKASASKGQCSTRRQTSAGRKALATMGRRGAETTNKRRWADRSRPDAQAALQPLKKANQKRILEAQGERLTIAGWFLRTYAEVGTWPTIADAMSEYNVSRPTVKRALKAANITLPRGRRATSN